MNWEVIHVVLTVILAVAGLINYLMLLSIQLAMVKLMLELKEWARKEFPSNTAYEMGEEATQRQIDDLKNKSRGGL
ncbi:MAG: hypothetical protein ACLPWF_04650 [Bryobacteraceae bacterium]